MSEHLIPWVAVYLVERASIEPNLHTLIILTFLDHLADSSLNSLKGGGHGHFHNTFLVPIFSSYTFIQPYFPQQTLKTDEMVKSATLMSPAVESRQKLPERLLSRLL